MHFCYFYHNRVHVYLIGVKLSLVNLSYFNHWLFYTVEIYVHSEILSVFLKIESLIWSEWRQVWDSNNILNMYL